LSRRRSADPRSHRRADDSRAAAHELSAGLVRLRNRPRPSAGGRRRMSEVEVVEDPPVWKRRRVQIAAVLGAVLIIGGWCWHRHGAADEEAAQPIVSV